MEEQRRASERRKLQVLRALTIMNEFSDEDILDSTADLEKLDAELEKTLKERAASSKLKIVVRPVDPETAIAQLKDEAARKRNPAAAVKRKREPTEPSRRSARVCGAPARYSYADLLGEDDDDDDDDEGVKKRGKRRKLNEDGEWSGKQRTSQLSRGELKPYVKRDNTFGPMEDIPVGMWWSTRMECSRDGIHRPTVAGIHGGPDGVYSIALSGGYAENEDFGEHFWFTGEGGRDLKGTKANPKNLRTAPQSKDQTWSRGNLAIYKSIESGTPVRVVRGYSKNKDYTSPYAPETGYRYDGLYKVVDFKVDNGVTGFNVFRFKFERLPGQEPLTMD